MEVLYLRHRQRVLRYAARIVFDSEDCQDILQETFKYVFSKIPTYEPKAKFTTFLYTVTHHTALNWVSKKRKRFHLLQENVYPTVTETSHAQAPSDQLIEKEELLSLRKGISQLSELHQQILHLRLVEELAYEEIAEILQIPIGTVKSRLHNGVAHLREVLNPSDPKKNKS